MEELDHVAKFGFGAHSNDYGNENENGDSNTHVTAEMDEKICDNDATTSLAIAVSNASFTWDAKTKNRKPTLSNINITIAKGELIGIVGSVGSGKSSLILALLREMHQLKGGMKLQGTVAYCSQQAWIRNATVQDNILFGLPFNENLYNKVLEASALENDLKALAGGDDTEIGERGINLSGGQKARVSLARALYLSSDRDIFLLDDPLSAVDEETATQIFSRAIKNSSSSSSKKAMLNDKTRLLVMNSHLHLLAAMDRVIVMEKGTIKSFGTLNHVIKECHWLEELMRGENSFLNQNNNNKKDDHDKNEDDLETSNKDTPVQT